MREITTKWTTRRGAPGVSVMYFEEAASIAAQRLSLAVLWESVAAAMDLFTTWEIATEGRSLSPVSGELTGTWVESTLRDGTGDVSGGGPIPDATQALIQWQTGVIRRGRRVRGRTFVPGFADAVIIDGELGSGTVAGITTSAQTFVDSGVGFGVWHRPINSVGGELIPVSVATVWTELAVQRRRRG